MKLIPSSALKSFHDAYHVIDNIGVDQNLDFIFFIEVTV